MFTGREWFPEVAIYDYRNRMYEPTLGRFLQADPKGFDAGDMNLFRYCGDDPVDHSDPMGLDSITVEFTSMSDPVPMTDRSGRRQDSGHVHSGTLHWLNDAGKEIRTIPVNSGGYKTKDSHVKGKETRIMNGKYKATYDVGNAGGDMKRDGVGYRIALDPAFKQDPKNYQTDLRFHPDGGTPGTHGCIGLATDAAKLKEFRQAVNEYVDHRGALPVEVRGNERLEEPPGLQQGSALQPGGRQ